MELSQLQISQAFTNTLCGNHKTQKCMSSVKSAFNVDVMLID